MKLAQGAEAVIYLKDGKIVKERVSKNYRIPQLDEKIRKKTTRFESRLLERAAQVVNVPKILKSCDKAMVIEMEFLEGEKLRDLVDNMSPEEMRRVVKLIPVDIETEASGGITLDNIGEVAGAGVKVISVGALTHSAKALDISLELDPQSLKL